MRRFYRFSMCQEVKIRFIVLLRAHNISLLTTNYLWNKIYIFFFVGLFTTHEYAVDFFIPWCGLCFDWGPMVVFLISVDYKAFSLLVFLSWQRFFILTWNIYNTINVSTTEWNGMAVSYIAPHIMTAVIQIDIIFFLYAGLRVVSFASIIISSL